MTLAQLSFVSATVEELYYCIIMYCNYIVTLLTMVWLLLVLIIVMMLLGIILLCISREGHWFRDVTDLFDHTWYVYAAIPDCTRSTCRLAVSDYLASWKITQLILYTSIAKIQNPPRRKSGRKSEQLPEFLIFHQKKSVFCKL